MAHNLFIHGFHGKMGQEIAQSATNQADFSLLGGSDQEMPLAENFKKNAELIIDFSISSATEDLLNFLKNNPCPHLKALLVGTTGLSEETIASFQKLAAEKNMRIMVAANTSIGVYTVAQSLKQLVQLHDLDFDIEIEETHHRHKVDAPSGTALYLANTLQQEKDLKTVDHRVGKRQSNEIGMSVTRGGGVFGEHKIRFISPHEEVSISHRAFSRSLFAEGALTMAKKLLMKPVGFYTLDNF